MNVCNSVGVAWKGSELVVAMRVVWCWVFSHIRLATRYFGRSDCIRPSTSGSERRTSYYIFLTAPAAQQLYVQAPAHSLLLHGVYAVAQQTPIRFSL